ncbi:hypothetical protein ACFOOK_31935 [Micromonospora krabiensis]|uniref:Uncharacterized protein n=1 Tax=Micromonospora krabiensis TaxID=307121 RepID=A0A1C3MY98_9ACTN|nr:hypothetical protein [Micromonospora krabiensis]SBV25312.1 hypothetical protein GA0070620_0784 [Micromonospora krabiensis]
MPVVLPHRARPLLAAAAVLAAAALSACAGADEAPPAAAPSASSGAAVADVAPSQPPIKGKLRGYTTVQELTEAAELVVRGEVEAAGFRVDEVLRAASGSGVTAGSRITLTGLDRRTADMAQMSTLDPGQVVVLYLAKDPATATFRTLSGDFGVFDVDGAGEGAAASTRSRLMAVTGLRAEDPAAAGQGFRTTLGQLRAVAAQVR